MAEAKAKGKGLAICRRWLKIPPMNELSSQPTPSVDTLASPGNVASDLNLVTAPLGSLWDNLRLREMWLENDPSAWLFLLAGIFGGLLVGKILSLALGRIAQHCEARGWTGKARVITGVIGPASLAILTIGLSFGLLDLKMTEALCKFVGNAKQLLYLIAIFWYLYNLIDVIEVVVRRFVHDGEGSLDRQFVSLLSRSLRIFLVVVGTLSVAESVFHQDIGAWLAGFGIAGLAVSLAAQDSLKHLFGSFTILVERSFRIGDRVISGSIDGTIEDIGFRSTRLRTLAGHLVTIPNSNLVNAPIENMSRRPAIRRIVTLFIPGSTSSEKIRQVLDALGRIFQEDDLRGPVVLAVAYGGDRAPKVHFEDIQENVLKLTLTYWYAPANDPSYSDHAERVNLRIIEELDRVGVDLVAS
jgi:MscS family membrane protein